MFSIQSGQLVEAAQTIGRVGEPDARGRNFYFEVRHNGKAVNPSKYLVRVLALAINAAGSPL